MDAKGKKMSKSLGNTIDPLKVMEQTGADIIRLWALSVDFTEDHRIGDEILKGVGDQYRRLRNTFRYLLGALDGYIGDMSDAGEIPELELYVLSLLSELDGKLKKAAAEEKKSLRKSKAVAAGDGTTSTKAKKPAASKKKSATSTTKKSAATTVVAT